MTRRTLRRGASGIALALIVSMADAVAQQSLPTIDVGGVRSNRLSGVATRLDNQSSQGQDAGDGADSSGVAWNGQSWGPANPKRDPKTYNKIDTKIGTKTDTPIMQTPINVQVVPQQVLRDQQVTTLDQAILNVSGVVPGNSGNLTGGLSDSFIIRGFQTNTLFRNGFRIENIANVAPPANGAREMANVQQVDVLKGPAAILYGRTEPGGAINIVTKEPLAKPMHAAQQQVGSFGNWRSTVDVTGPVTQDDTLLYRVNLSYQKSGAFRQFINSDRFFIAPVVTWNITPKTKLTLDLEYGRSLLNYDMQSLPFIGRQVINAIQPSRNTGEPLPSRGESVFGQLRGSHEFNADWKASGAITINKSKGSLMEAGGNAWLAPNFSQVLRTLVGAQTSVTQHGAEGNLTGHFSTAFAKHTFLLGGDYYRYSSPNVVQFACCSFINPYLPNHPGEPPLNWTSLYFAGFGFTNAWQQNSDSFGVYVQDQVELPYGFHILAGARYQTVYERTKTAMNFDAYVWGDPWRNLTTNPTLSADAVTPRFGLLWQPQEWLSIYGNYVEGFGPNFGVTRDKKMVPPTNARSWEAGVKTEFFDGRLGATATYFYLTKTNIPTTDPSDLSYLIAIGEARSKGVEFDMHGEILPGWKLIATYAFTDARVTKSNNDSGTYVGDLLPGVPRNMGRFWSTYDFQTSELNGLKIGGGVTAQDKTCTMHNLLCTAGIATIDAMASYDFKIEEVKLTAQLNATNLLNSRNFVTNQTFDVGAGTVYGGWAPPTTLIGSIRAQF